MPKITLTGDRDLVLQTILNDPLSSRLDIDQAKSVLVELLEAHRACLPQFYG
jgi:alpha-galactosidase/6-phospho-beta-glucosidase family protein